VGDAVETGVAGDAVCPNAIHPAGSNENRIKR
jgi:hypothetical protein